MLNVSPTSSARCWGKGGKNQHGSSRPHGEWPQMKALDKYTDTNNKIRYAIIGQILKSKIWVELRRNKDRLNVQNSEPVGFIV